MSKKNLNENTNLIRKLNKEERMSMKKRRKYFSEKFKKAFAS